MTRSAAETRTNDQWLTALRANGKVRESALTDLRALLLDGLRRGIGRTVRRGREFDALLGDFVQEALLAITDRLDTFRGESRFETWAHKVAVRIALTELRRKRWQDVRLEQVTSDEDGRVRLLADRDAGPAERYERAEAVDVVLELIRTELTEKQRIALTALSIGGLPIEEVARRMDTNRNALYKVVHDARKRLKARLVDRGMSVDEVLEAVGG